jgi:hypothetical protein
LASRQDLAGALAALAEGDSGAVSLPFLDADDCRRLTAASARLSYRPARPIIGEGDKAVYQDFTLSMEIAPQSLIARFAGALEARLAEALAGMRAPPLAAIPRLNDWIAQLYPVGSIGITPHRDHLRYRDLVLLITLTGQARLWVCRDRSGAGAQEVDIAPGRLVLMRAPGFADSQERPFHTLTEVTRRRYSLGIRHDREKA